MSKGTSVEARVIGQIVGNGVPMGLMVWAGVATEGVLRWALFGWVILTVIAIMGMSAAKAAKS